jgi:hypothetical protein
MRKKIDVKIFLSYLFASETLDGTRFYLQTINENFVFC